MTNVIIVSRTRTKTGVCVGGFDQIALRNVRLLPAEGTRHQPPDSPFRVGQLWEMDLATPRRLEAPHVEDMIVMDCRMKLDHVDFKALIRKAGQPTTGMASDLFSGFLVLNENRKARILHQHVPGASVAFWVPTRDLVRDPSDERRVMVPWAEGLLGVERISAPYVGDTDGTPDTIPAGSLVRVSLSTWHAPKPGDEQGCWLQVSGWYEGPRAAGAGTGSVQEVAGRLSSPRSPKPTEPRLRLSPSLASEPALARSPKPTAPTLELSPSPAGEPASPPSPSPSPQPTSRARPREVKGTFKSFADLQRAMNGPKDAVPAPPTTKKARPQPRGKGTPTAGTSKSPADSEDLSPKDRALIGRLVAADERRRAAGQPLSSTLAGDIAKLAAKRRSPRPQPIPRVRRAPKTPVWTERMALDAVNEVARQRQSDSTIGGADRVSRLPPPPDDWRDQD